MTPGRDFGTSDLERGYPYLNRVLERGEILQMHKSFKHQQ